MDNDIKISNKNIRIDENGTVFLCGFRYSEKNRVRDSVWNIRDPVDFMSWAYTRNIPFETYTKKEIGIFRVTAYVEACADFRETPKTDCLKNGLNVWFYGKGDDRVSSMSYGFDRTRTPYAPFRHCSGLSFYKGNFEYIDEDGYYQCLDELVGYL